MLATRAAEQPSSMLDASPILHMLAAGGGSTLVRVTNVRVTSVRVTNVRVTNVRYAVTVMRLSHAAEHPLLHLGYVALAVSSSKQACSQLQ